MVLDDWMKAYVITLPWKFLGKSGGQRKYVLDGK
jgi:hypothetical protein